MPAGQGPDPWASTAPFSHFRPALHGLQSGELAPPSEYLPFLQGPSPEVRLRTPSQYLPAGQGEHASAPSSEYVPLGHLAGMLTPRTLQTYPAGQRIQVEAFPVENLPVAQRV